MSKKNILVIIAIIIIVVGGYLAYRAKTRTAQPIVSEKLTLNAKNCTYAIGGKSVALKDGYSEEEIVPGSASKLITRYFGNEISGDFNNDGLPDIAFLFTQETGGSGTFYYVAAALGSENGCIGTNAIFLGDRIAPQTTEFRNGEIIVNYAEIGPGKPITVQPSVGVSKYLKIEGNNLIEIQK